MPSRLNRTLPLLEVVTLWAMLIESCALLLVAFSLQAVSCVVGLRVIDASGVAEKPREESVSSGVKTFVIALVVLAVALGIGLLLAQGGLTLRVWLVVTGIFQVNGLRFVLRAAGVNIVVRWAIVLASIGILVLWYVHANWLTTDAASFVAAISALVSLALIIGTGEKARQYLLSVPLWVAASLAAALFDLAAVFGNKIMLLFADRSLHANINNMVVAPYVPSTPSVPTAVSTGAPVPPSWIDALLHAPPLFSIGLGDIIFPGWLLLVMAVWARHYGRRSLIVLPFAGYLAGGATCLAVVLTTYTAQPALPYLFSGVFLGIAAAALRAKVGKQLFAVRRRPQPVSESTG